MESDYVKKNKNEFLRMKNILDNLSQSQWDLKVSENWTIGNLLCHLAFWDNMTYARLSSWKKNGKLASIPDEETVAAINFSVQDLCNLLNSKTAASFILKSAEQTDNFVADLTPIDINFLKDTGKERWFMRHAHRSLHLDKIENTLR